MRQVRLTIRSSSNMAKKMNILQVTNDVRSLLDLEAEVDDGELEHGTDDDDLGNGKYRSIVRHFTIDPLT